MRYLTSSVGNPLTIKVWRRCKDGAKNGNVYVVIAMVSLALKFSFLRFVFLRNDENKLFFYRISGLSLVRRGILQNQSFRSQGINAVEIPQK